MSTEDTAVAEQERRRIARELHDAVGHHVAVIGIQAAGAQRVLPADADRAREALAAIEHASRQAAAELQQVLRSLQDSDDTAVRTPLLTLLEELVTQVRAAGLSVAVLADALPDLPSGLEVAALRVVQEALTNVLRHSGPGASAWVRLSVARAGLRVRVTDDGRGKRQPAAGGSGRGLAGLAERVDAVGGSFVAGPRTAGGFQVVATLPLQPGGAPPPATTSGATLHPCWSRDRGSLRG